jgi:hypothetical protein
MNSSEIQKLFNRLARLSEATQNKAGGKTAWDYTFSNGESHRYIFRNIKSHEEVEDNIFNLYIWIWNAKDYLKNRAKSKGRDPKYIERVINDDPLLQICADLANWLKHAKLKKSRSGKFPKLGSVKFTAHQSTIKSIIVRAFEVDIEFANPDGVEFKIPILDKADNQIGDAFEYAEEAIHRLEKLREKIEQHQ